MGTKSEDHNAGATPPEPKKHDPLEITPDYEKTPEDIQHEAKAQAEFEKAVGDLVVYDGPDDPKLFLPTKTKGKLDVTGYFHYVATDGKLKNAWIDPKYLK